MTRSSADDALPEGTTSTLTRRQALTGMMVALTVPSLVQAQEALAANAPEPNRAEGVFADARELPVSVASGLARSMHTATALSDGRILLAGGYHQRPADGSTAATPLSSVQIYDPLNEIWFNAAPMLQVRARHAAVLLPDGRVLVLGGMVTAPTASAEFYSPATNTWSLAAPLVLACYDHAAVYAGDRVIITGGVHQTALSRVEVYIL